MRNDGGERLGDTDGGDVVGRMRVPPAVERGWGYGESVVSERSRWSSLS